MYPAIFATYPDSAKRFNRKRVYLITVFCIIPFLSSSQTTEMPGATPEQQLENITENNDDAEIEDDTYLQQMQQFLKEPVNLNTAGEAELKELPLLNVLQIQQLISYRKLFGKFIDIYELQAVPGWSVDLIQKLRLYVTVSEKPLLVNTIKSRLSMGEHTILARASQIIEKSKGYLSGTAANFYPGSPQKLLLRYKYQFKNELQYGVLGEKDAGEQFFKGKQKQGFDFYSAHFFVRNIGSIKSLALGDFTVNLGQGLIQWQSLAFKKSSDVINIKRDAPVLRPYNAAGEINFHRGAGITIEKGKFQITAFTSYKKIDGNLVADTSQLQQNFIAALQTSGYHRTRSEATDKGIQQQLAFGGNITYQFKRLQVGLNVIHYKFKIPIKRSGDLYNLYALSGNSFGNYSIDYSYTYKNIHFFGEAATTNSLDKALISGMLISTSSTVDMSFLYRNITKGYQSFYATAFTENSFPANENGFYMGISVHPGSIWRFDSYADFFKFPWMKFRVNTPATGSDYLLQLTYKPNKQLVIYSRFRSESKPINKNPLLLPMSLVIAQPRQNWRTQFSYKLNTKITLRSRVELLWFDKNSSLAEQGFLTYADVFYKPVLKSWAANLRLQYFETEGYDSRVYAYENDVLYGYSIPVFYDKGFRYYINVNYDVNKKITLWLKWSQTIYDNKTLIGSGLDEINSKKRSEIRIQLLYKF